MCPIFSTNLFGQRVELGLRLMPTLTSTNIKTSSGGKISGEATLGFGIGGLLTFNFTDHVGVQGANFRLHQTPVSAFKTANALPYILAGIFARENSFDDVFLLNTEGVPCRSHFFKFLYF